MKRTLVWLARIRHSRGFGIQSPNDYRFVRYVVNEHWPYYAYDTLKRTLKDVDGTTRKLGRLYMRLANYVQPAAIVDVCPESDALSQYAQAGCKRADTRAVDNAGKAMQFIRQRKVLLSVDASKLDEESLKEMTSMVGKDSIVVVKHIKKGRHERQLWKMAADDQRVTVSYDLYYCGLLLFESRKYQQRYKVNF